MVGQCTGLTSVRDTVSSVGLIRGDVFLSTSSSAAHACHFRHALALDELRVKFMPEYFHEMNSLTDDGKYERVITSGEVKHVTSPTSERRESAVSDDGIALFEGKEKTSDDIKEVWFAGSHSDVCVRLRTHSHNTDMLRTGVVGTLPESLTRPGMSRYHGCVEKRLLAVLYCTRRM